MYVYLYGNMDLYNHSYHLVVPNYGAKKQYAVGPDGTVLLDKDGKKFVQQVTGTFLYYA